MYCGEGDAKWTPSQPRTVASSPEPDVQSASFAGDSFEADGGTRTPDPIITSDVLYQLSYVGDRAAATKPPAASAW